MGSSIPKDDDLVTFHLEHDQTTKKTVVSHGAQLWSDAEFKTRTFTFPDIGGVLHQTLTCRRDEMGKVRIGSSGLYLLKQGIIPHRGDLVALSTGHISWHTFSGIKVQRTRVASFSITHFDICRVMTKLGLYVQEVIPLLSPSEGTTITDCRGIDIIFKDSRWIIQSSREDISEDLQAQVTVGQIHLVRFWLHKGYNIKTHRFYSGRLQGRRVYGGWYTLHPQCIQDVLWESAGQVRTTLWSLQVASRLFKPWINEWFLLSTLGTV